MTCAKSPVPTRRLATLALLLGLLPTLDAAAATPPLATFPDRSGVWSNLNLSGLPARQGPFFESLGSNGRTCASCHAPNDGWTATPRQLQRRFNDSAGADPVFSPLDGTNCPGLDIQTPQAHATASSLLLNRGLIRVEMPVPANAEFAVSRTLNPYGCGSTSTLSVYRRIPMAANLHLLSEVMWDGRESAPGRSVRGALLLQASHAIVGHAAATGVPAAATLNALVNFETGQFSAQQSDTLAGSLSTAGATGGPTALAAVRFVAGGNPPFRADGSGGVPPQPVFSLFAPWRALTGADAVSRARASIARGEQIFNTRPVVIRGVAGLNDVPGANGLPRTEIVGTCGTCHNTPNGGGHSSPLTLNIGIADARGDQDLPVFTLINKTTGASLTSTDPGRALVTGKWADAGKFKVPSLRNLAARPPYFHDGSAPGLGQVLEFYQRRFHLQLTPGERADLVAFLQSL